MSGYIEFDIVVENRTRRDLAVSSLSFNGGGMRRATGLDLDAYRQLRITMGGSTMPMAGAITIEGAGLPIKVTAETDGETSSATVNDHPGITVTTLPQPAGQPGKRRVTVILE